MKQEIAQLKGCGSARDLILGLMSDEWSGSARGVLGYWIQNVKA
jgi:hypothetical protein